MPDTNAASEAVRALVDELEALGIGNGELRRNVEARLRSRAKLDDALHGPANIISRDPEEPAASGDDLQHPSR